MPYQPALSDCPKSTIPAEIFPRCGIMTPTAPTRMAGPVASARASTLPWDVGHDSPGVRLGSRSGRASNAATAELPLHGPGLEFAVLGRETRLWIIGGAPD